MPLDRLLPRHAGARGLGVRGRPAVPTRSWLGRGRAEPAGPHILDLAINEVLALAGRDERRDLLDVLHCHAHVLPHGALMWAAAGKDPGFSPLSLLELLRRRGRVRPEELARLHLAGPVDVVELKAEWRAALDEAERFIRRRPPGEAGCLYYALDQRRFVDPDEPGIGPVVVHFGTPGGVVPRMLEDPAGPAQGS